MECECEICKKIKGRILREKDKKIYCFINRKPHFVADALEFRKHMWEEWRRARARTASVTRARIIASGKVTKNQWLDIIKSLDNKCAYCRKKFSGSNPPTVDHIIPLNSNLAGMYRGRHYYGVIRVRGTHSAENITVACRSCNAVKNVHPPKELLFRITRREFYGLRKSRDRVEKIKSEKIKRTPGSKVREWYFKNALKLIADRKKNNEHGHLAKKVVYAKIAGK